jgi:hypothetical protein
LSERVHLGKLGMIGATGTGVMHGLLDRFRRVRDPARRVA